MIAKGSCHCRKVAYEVEGELTQLIECNCSICSKKGALLWMGVKHFRLLTPADALATYTFNTHQIKHRFCPNCGIHVFGERTTPDGETRIAINARTLDGVDLSTLPIKPFDGRSL